MKERKIGDKHYHWFTELVYIPIIRSTCDGCYYQGRSRCINMICWKGMYVRVKDFKYGSGV
jgi:hypothetical protein